MQNLSVPSIREIGFMSLVKIQRERVRLLNEISFARGEEAIGGKPCEETILACKQAIEAIDERLRTVSRSMTDESQFEQRNWQ
jgi:hypothetical protein